MNDREWATTVFNDIRRIGLGCSGPSDVGVSRDSYGTRESLAIEYLQECADIPMRMDDAANMWFGYQCDRPAGKWERTVASGSHVDSVKNGGNYDGLAGVVAAILVARRLHGHVPMRAVALRGEESAWFGEAYKGSRALFGRLPLQNLPLLSAAMACAGARVQQLTQPLMESEKVTAFVELHIEQGPVLANERKMPLAAVVGIVGNKRWKIVCHGESGHSGTTPRHTRRDAVLATAHLLNAMEDVAHISSSTITAGVVRTSDDAQPTKIPDRVEFTLETRSGDLHALTYFETHLHTFMTSIGHDRRVRFSFADEKEAAPVGLSGGVLEVIEEVLGMPRSHSMWSGAGHDAVVFQDAGVPSGMIFVRNQNGSHNPREAMDMDDFMLGVDALEKTMRTLHEQEVGR